MTEENLEAFLPAFFALIFMSKVSLPSLSGSNDEANGELLTVEELAEVGVGFSWLSSCSSCLETASKRTCSIILPETHERLTHMYFPKTVLFFFCFALFVVGCNVCPFPVIWDFPCTPWPIKNVKVWLCRDVGLRAASDTCCQVPSICVAGPAPTGDPELLVILSSFAHLGRFTWEPYIRLPGTWSQVQFCVWSANSVQKSEIVSRNIWWMPQTCRLWS